MHVIAIALVVTAFASACALPASTEFGPHADSFEATPAASASATPWHQGDAGHVEPQEGAGEPIDASVSDAAPDPASDAQAAADAAKPPPDAAAPVDASEPVDGPCVGVPYSQLGSLCNQLPGEGCAGGPAVVYNGCAFVHCPCPE